MSYEHSVLPAISAETVWKEVKRLLLDSGGVSNPEIINQVVDKDRTIEEACPEAIQRVRDQIVLGNPEVERLKAQVDRWRYNPAMEALGAIDHDRRMALVHQLRQRFADRDDRTLDGKMADILEAALLLTDPDAGLPAVKLIPDSALGLFEDLASSTGDPVPHELGDPDHVPSHLTLA